MKKVFLVIVAMAMAISVIRAESTGTVKGEGKLDFSQVNLNKVKAINLTKLTDDNVQYRKPKWSPDNTVIAVSKIKEKGIFLVDLKTKKKTKIENTDESLGDYSWADGGINFRDKNHKTKKVLVSNYKNVLGRIILKGNLVQDSDKIYLKNKNSMQLIAPWGKNPIFLEDGSVQYQIDDNLYVIYDGEKREIYHKYRSGVTRPYSKTEEIVESMVVSENMACSPDGKFIIYADRKDDGYNYTASELKIKEIGTKGNKKIIDVPNLIPDQLDWSFDGRKIIFLDWKSDSIYSVDLDIKK
ncbi:MAG: hypothetical protein A2539_10250 [Elusimicrobia bacterium RIFOXYD2_FULL_34_15]|nr:MAG: hypothetical protein A2539_10250 [Elusimicrobia bacterium RIFOXYD2_FULL_34_15]